MYVAVVLLVASWLWFGYEITRAPLFEEDDETEDCED